MADYTENYGFKKPARTDRFNIADLNGNMDMIDAAIAQSAGRTASAPSTPTLMTLSAPSSAAEKAGYIPPPQWAYDTGQGAAGVDLTVNARKSGLLVVAVQYSPLDSNKLSLSGDGWTKIRKSGALGNYATVIEIYTKPVTAGEHTVTVTQQKTGSLLYAHAFCLYGARSLEVINDTGTSGKSYAVQAGTAGKRRLYFLQQGAQSNTLTVTDLSDYGMIDSTYLTTIWDIYFADTSAPTFTYSKAILGLVVCEVTMETTETNESNEKEG